MPSTEDCAPESSAAHQTTASDQLLLVQSLRARLLKRCVDLIGALMLILILLPLFITITLLVALIEGAPIIHRRRVLGPNGEFDAFKFRSMCRDADNILEKDLTLQRMFSRDFKLKSDPRVTELGAVLRRYSLDELPQLFNVLLGQMSLVGPRMITAPEIHKYGSYGELLLKVKPGLTGYWQVRGRQDVSYSERVRMDVDYITHWRLWMDVKILALTPMRVITGKGAY